MANDSENSIRGIFVFGRAPRGISERPKAMENSKAIPSWLWLMLFVLAGLCVVIFLSLWSPWKPVVTTVHTSNAMAIADEDTNKDYRFYDLLPRQQVTPIPEQAIPEQQQKHAVMVVEVPHTSSSAASATANDTTAKQSNTQNSTSIAPRYILQVRSYEDADSADIRRAEIVRNGLSAEVIMGNEGKQVWYRVISGPYESQDAAVIAQQTLQNSGIDSIIVKQSLN